MKETDFPLQWRFIVLPFVAIVGFLMVLGELRGGPLLSPTAVVAAPIAFAVCAAWFAYIRHRERVDPGRAEQRIQGFYRTMLALALAVFTIGLVREPSWSILLSVAGYAALAWAEWRSHRRERTAAA